MFVSLKHEADKLIVFDRGGTRDRALVFVFNLHPTKSFEGYMIGVPFDGTWEVVLNSDAPEFGGMERIDETVRHFARADPYHDRPARMQIYTPARSCVVYRLVHV